MPRVMEVTTPLGDDVLLFHGMHAREEMGRLSEYQLDLLGPVKDKDINLDDILGKNVTVKLALPDDSTRYFNGYVTRFSAGGRSYGRFRRYSAVVRPWLWFLTRTTDCRIFQEMTVPDIIKEVFGDEPTADFSFELTCAYRKWTYCVQYRGKPTFTFVSRPDGGGKASPYYIEAQRTGHHNRGCLTDFHGPEHTGELPRLLKKLPVTFAPRETGLVQARELRSTFQQPWENSWGPENPSPRGVLSVGREPTLPILWKPVPKPVS